MAGKAIHRGGHVPLVFWDGREGYSLRWTYPRSSHLFCQLVLVFSRCLLQLCNASLLLLDHGAQVLNAIVVWQFIFGHLQAAVQNETRIEQALQWDIIGSWLIL